MTDTEKKVMMRLCTKILAQIDLYEIDTEVRNLVDWICVSEQMEENNNKIRSLTGEYKQIEPEWREGVKEKLIVTQYVEMLFKIDYCKMLNIAFEIILQIAIKYLDILIICVILKLL